MGEAAYTEAMMQELSQLSVIHARALTHLTVGEQIVAWAYNKKVREKIFEEGEMALLISIWLIDNG